MYALKTKSYISGYTFIVEVRKAEEGEKEYQDPGAWEDLKIYATKSELKNAIMGILERNGEQGELERLMALADKNEATTSTN